MSKAHQLASFPTPTDDRQFKTLFEGISREKDVKQKQAPAFTFAYLKRVVNSIDTQRPDGVRALLLLGLASAFALRRRWLVVELPKSKTNQKGEAEEKAIFFAPDRRNCPVRAAKDWLELLYQHHGCSSSPLFLTFYKGQRLSRRRLSPLSLNEAVQLHLVAPYTAHSLRTSFVTITKLNGANKMQVMHQTIDMIRHYT